MAAFYNSQTHADRSDAMPGIEVCGSEKCQNVSKRLRTSLISMYIGES